MQKPLNYDNPPPYTACAGPPPQLPGVHPLYPPNYNTNAPIASVYYPSYGTNIPPGQIPVPNSATTTTTTVIVPPDIIVIGACPACRIGILEDDYPCLGLFCAIFFFPIGLLCCLAMKNKRCSNCGAVFG